METQKTQEDVYDTVMSNKKYEQINKVQSVQS